jgi:metal-dependent amidase/aminoacylase/carboxypeptidase family protein
MMKTLKLTSLVRPLAMLTFAIVSTVAAAFDPTQEKARVAAILDRTYPHLESLYKDIHSHPELGFHETRTAAILAKQIRALGFEVTEGFGGSTGIVAVYRNGPGPTIMIRTELDALPMEDKTGLPYASHVQVSS